MTNKIFIEKIIKANSYLFKFEIPLLIRGKKRYIPKYEVKNQYLQKIIGKQSFEILLLIIEFFLKKLKYK